MRGAIKSQSELVCLISPDSVVPKGHPIRTIKRYVDDVLSRMNRRLDAMYAQEGRPSIPPERLLKAKVLIALFSVRSENLFVEQLHYSTAISRSNWPLTWATAPSCASCTS
jgi:transposase